MVFRFPTRLSRYRLIIPPGYTLLTDWQEEHTEAMPPRRNLRYFYADEKVINMPFVFDEENKEYADLLKSFKKDTNRFLKALAKALKATDLSVWIEIAEPSAEKRKYIRLLILLRPLFFHSEYDDAEKADERMQAKKDVINLVLHFDQEHKFQVVRMVGEDRNLFQTLLADAINRSADSLKNSYGDWEAMSYLFVQNIQRIVDYLRREGEI